MNLTIDKEYKEVLSGSSEFPNKCNCINCYYNLDLTFSDNKKHLHLDSDLTEYKEVISGSFNKRYHLNKN